MTEELKDLAKGGIWQDEEKGSDSLQWRGETPTVPTRDEAEQDDEQTSTLKTKTQRQLDKSTLEEAGITNEVLKIIANHVVRQQHVSLDSKIEARMAVMEDMIKEMKLQLEGWKEAQEARLSEREKQQGSTLTKEIRRFDDELSSMRHKTDEIIRNVTVNGASEVKMIHEALQIIKDNHRAREESEDDVLSTPSVAGRINARAEALTDTLRKLEPMTPSAFTAKREDLPKQPLWKGKIGARR